LVSNGLEERTMYNDGPTGIDRTPAVLGLYGLSHAAVDAACATLVFAGIASGRIPAEQALLAVVAYNLIAFALQPAFGLAVDRLGAEKPAAVLGALLTAAALPLSFVPGMVIAGLVLAGLGNAIFHVGGGAVSLRLEPGSASAPGIFVAPGAAGLAAGTLLGKAGGALWMPAVALGVLALAMAVVPLALRATAGPSRPRPYARAAGAGLDAAVMLVLLVVAMRSFTGFAIALPWKADLGLLAWLTVAVVLGKAAGGLLADRFGRARIGVGALAFSAPLLMLATFSPVAGILGMFVFNMTMPITLIAVADAIPEYPGFAFGTASLAIVVGALPVIAGWSLKLPGALGVAVAVWGAAAILAVALFWLEHGRLLPRAASPITEVGK
jgi:FSR family fosmidomycin resistance protein-like MFS transporter